MRSTIPLLVVALVITACSNVSTTSQLPSPSGGPSTPAPSSRSPSMTAPATATPDVTHTPHPTHEPTPAPNPILSNRAIAELRVDALNVRETGSPTARVLGQLSVGARVFVIGTPQVVEDMYWYRVGVVDGTYTGAECSWHPCVTDIGHVATPVNEDPWLVESEVVCPPSPMSAADLAALHPLEQLHCYGDQEIVLSGLLDTPCCSYFGPIQFDPAWLARPDGPAYFAVAGNGPPIWFRMDPAAGLEVPARGDVVRATAHFDHDAATSCRASPDPSIGAEGFDPETDLPSVAGLILDCRARFVVTDYEVIDHQDVGPCCGRERARPHADADPGDEAVPTSATG
jgi:hypothetical protein